MGICKKTCFLGDTFLVQKKGHFPNVRHRNLGVQKRENKRTFLHPRQAGELAQRSKKHQKWHFLATFRGGQTPPQTGQFWPNFGSKNAIFSIKNRLKTGSKNLLKMRPIFTQNAFKIRSKKRSIFSTKNASKKCPILTQKTPFFSSKIDQKNDHFFTSKKSKIWPQKVTKIELKMSLFSIKIHPKHE